MKKLLNHILALLFLAFSPALHADMKETGSSIFDNSVYHINRGMDAVLELTPEQHAKILTVYDECFNDEQLIETRKEAQQSKKTGSVGSDAIYQVHLSKLRDIRKKYREALSEILTDEQKDLVKSLDRLGGDVEKEAHKEDNKAERVAKVKELGTPRLSEVLTPAQIQLLNAE
jgi:Spy/CpxP family protein refolding chaperone